MSKIKDLQEKVVGFRDRRDWKKFHNPKDLALSLVLEATEVLEHFQWKSNKESAEYLKKSKNKKEVAEELADVLWWLLIISNEFKIDLSEALLKKIQKNKRRYPVNKSKGTAKKYTELK